MRALATIGVDEEQAKIVADVLVAADLRGIESHGVARLRWFYVDRIRNGRIAARPAYTIVRQTPTSMLMDAGNGLGHPASHRAMISAIERAQDSGIAFTAVRNSNHFGIAGYYAMMALEHDMIGICTTDSAHFAAPTFGRTKMQGTNPLAFAIPAGEEEPLRARLRDDDRHVRQARSLRAQGARAQRRLGRRRRGHPTNDPSARHHGALLPLGGYGTENGGHKGYGLGALAEILTGVLAAGWFGNALTLVEKPDAPSGITSHFFGAIRIDALRDADEFKLDMDRELRAFKHSNPAPGQTRVYVAGEIERENEIAFRRDGIPLFASVADDLDSLADRAQHRPGAPAEGLSALHAHPARALTRSPVPAASGPCSNFARCRGHRASSRSS